MYRFSALVAAAAFAATIAPAHGANALAEANEAFAKLTDYTATITVHEVDGRGVEDRTYAYAFKKPAYVKADIVAGPGKGGGIVWLGGDKVKGHRGGILSGIRLTLDLHNKQVLSLRGDSVDTGTFGAILDQLKTVKGEISESEGPPVDGMATDALTLKVAAPSTAGGVTKIVLYLSRANHLPSKRERFAGDQLVKSETITDVKINVGLKTSDFPF